VKREDDMRKLVVFFMIAVFSTVSVGCTGTFKVTKELYKFHRKQDKWVDEILFLGFAVFQVYSITLLGDAIIFNSIEFWTGKNPITSNTEANNTVAMKYDSKTKDIEVSNLNTGKSFVLARTDNGVIAKDRNGKVLFTSVEDSQGGVTVLDGNNKAIKHFSCEDVQRQRAEFFTR
jgi:hypothetical protein